MELLQLRYFFDAAALGSFALTAEKYMVPTTSVSASVKRLERELGCRLFERTPNRIHLNENGKRLQQSLYLVFRELDTAVRDLTAPPEDTRSIRMLVRAVRGQVTDRIVAFRACHPEIAFRTVLDVSPHAHADFDVIVDTKSDAYTGFDAFPLASLRMRLMASEAHPLADKPIPLSRLAAEPFVSWGEGSNMQRILVRACARAGFSPLVAVEAGDKECYEKLIASGVGIGLGREDRAMPGCVPLRVTDFDERYTAYVFCKPEANYGNVKKFLDFLKDCS